MTSRQKGLTYWLNQYYKLQKEILLVYHPNSDSPWSERCAYLGDNYSPNIPYNHRVILKNEIVIEFDNGSVEENRQHAEEVSKRLNDDGLSFAKFFSGNKSTHVHVFLDTGNAGDVQLLKRTFIRHYTRNLPIPDLQLAAPNHLIRAEGGRHEKTGRIKTYVGGSDDYPRVCSIPEVIWTQYSYEIRAQLSRRLAYNSSSLKAHPGFQYVLSTHKFRESGDGHERALFMLVHVLKPEYQEKQEELIKFLQDWYRYSGGNKMSEGTIAYKVKYQWNRDYAITQNYLEYLLIDIGRKDLCNEVLENEQR